ncbi:hypothetical protein [Vibrio harveyi]|uniref:hypothetical protein n=1 Tax=Vibrio harveyi TaxID=669 RepID=UPI0037C2EA18|nr:hypothetical protein [Vibrio parahaemolyticus]EKG9663393.1 hypothetical protein [Vibrio parahaemolyticus]EKG9668973.1 hypothetical protein [Vibrio parahaemolyticus]
MQIISKEKYREVLLLQLDHLNRKGNAHPDDLRDIVTAIEDSKTAEFEQVQVFQDGERLTFKPIHLEK